MSAGPRNSLARWGSLGVRSLLLPSGFWVRFRVPDPEEMLRRELVPPGLREIALQYATKGVDLGNADSDTLQQILQYTNALTAHGLRAIMPPEAAPSDGEEPDESAPEWEAITVSAGQFAELDMPSEDKATLHAVALRRMTPRQATWLSRQELGYIKTPEQELQARSESEQEAAGTTTGWESFREERGSADSGGASEHVVAAPERNARRARRSSRAGS